MNAWNTFSLNIEDIADVVIVMQKIIILLMYLRIFQKKHIEIY